MVDYHDIDDKDGLVDDDLYEPAHPDLFNDEDDDDWFDVDDSDDEDFYDQEYDDLLDDFDPWEPQTYLEKGTQP